MSSTQTKNETHGKKSVSFKEKEDSPKEAKEADDLKPEAGGILKRSQTVAPKAAGGAGATTTGMKKWKTLQGIVKGGNDDDAIREEVDNDMKAAIEQRENLLKLN